MSDIPEKNATSFQNRNYEFCPDQNLAKKLNGIDELADFIRKNKSDEGDLWDKIQEKLKISWTYNSNAIEGNTLTFDETLFFIREGLTVKGKPLKDFIETQNHVEAIDFLYDVIRGERFISESIIKEFNAFLLSGIKSTPAVDQFGNKTNKPARAGEYKQFANHVLQRDGSIHKYVEPEQVRPQMEFLVNWINDNIETQHPVIVAAIAHYNFVRIHPFDDGNGRGARLLMNLILIKKGIPPAVIENEKREDYIYSLRNADIEGPSGFINFIADSLIDTLNVIAEDIRKLRWRKLSGSD